SHRRCNILEMPHSSILELDFELVPHLPVGIFGDADAPRFRDPFQTCRHVDAVAENAADVQDDIAEINADAELDPFVRRHALVALRHAALNMDRAAHRVHDAAELDQHPIAGGFNDAPAVFGDAGIKNDAQMLPQTNERPLLIDASQPAIAD